jgi:hypothetical protein
MAAKGWQRAFDDPIPLPRGRQLVTLRDAAEYITKLSKEEHDAEPWQSAMEALLLVAELGGPTMFARIGVMRALNRHVEHVLNPDRKETHGGNGSWPATANFPSRDHRNEFLQAEPSTFLHKRHAPSFHGARNIYRPGGLVLRGA